MTEGIDKGLLPAGLQDILPPRAAHEAEIVERLIACFMAQGYDRVKPPLLEFEEALLSGAAAAVATQTFRLMDPVSQHMMGLRADITPQVARIAGTRLKQAPRPLRLCYGGEVLQVRGSQLRPERQFGQVGAELIGAPQEAADAEAVLLAVEALRAVGVGALSVDLNSPPLVGELAKELGFSEADTAALCLALDGKDAAAVQALAGDRAAPFLALLRAAGPIDKALEALANLDLPRIVAEEVAKLGRVTALIRRGQPELTMTLDPVEHRGFEYQTGISFILFARGVRGELGRGGRYATLRQNGGTAATSETATGFSLFMDTVLRALPAAAVAKRVLLPAGTDPQCAAALRADGWVTLAGFGAAADAEAEARHLRCSHLLREDEISEIEE